MKKSTRLNLGKGFTMVAVLVVMVLTACGAKDDDAIDYAIVAGVIEEPVRDDISMADDTTLELTTMDSDSVELTMEIEPWGVYDADNQKVTELQVGEVYTFKFWVWNTTEASWENDDACLRDVAYSFETPMSLTAGNNCTVRMTARSWTQDVCDARATWELTVVDDMILEPLAPYAGLSNGDVPVEAEVFDTISAIGAKDAVLIACSAAAYAPDEWLELKERQSVEKMTVDILDVTDSEVSLGVELPSWLPLTMNDDSWIMEARLKIGRDISEGCKAEINLHNAEYNSYGCWANVDSDGISNELLLALEYVSKPNRFNRMSSVRLWENGQEGSDYRISWWDKESIDLCLPNSGEFTYVVGDETYDGAFEACDLYLSYDSEMDYHLVSLRAIIELTGDEVQKLIEEGDGTMAVTFNMSNQELRLLGDF